MCINVVHIMYKSIKLVEFIIGFFIFKSFLQTIYYCLLFQVLEISKRFNI